MAEVGRLPIGVILILFSMYLISHYGIGSYRDYLEKQLKLRPKDEKIEKDLKNINFVFKWYAAFYLVFAVMILYVL